MMRRLPRLTPARLAPSSHPAAEPPPLAPLATAPGQCADLGWGLRQEWVVTNGIGGYAGSTIVGVNTRRTHGLLVAATRPPGGRAVLLAKLEETVVVPGARYDLATNRYPRVVHPEGYRYQEGFRLDPWPTFRYRIGELLLEKQVCMIPGENTTVISYHLRRAPGPVELLLRPLVACRDFRWISQENPTFRTRVEPGPGTLVLHPYPGLPPLVLHQTAELFEPSGYWYKQFEYPEDPVTLPPQHEDLYSPGQFLYLLRPGETAQVIASTDRIPAVHWPQLVPRAMEHHVAVLRHGPGGRARVGPLTRWLLLAADQCLVKAADGTRHVQAGYPGGGAWGRDALVALPGLTLATGRPEAARDLFQTMASHCRDGLLPVRFAEEDAAPQYDSVDTALWLFWAVDRYLRATGDVRFISRRLLDVLMDIVDYYVQGTQFHITMDQDGLITTAGEERPMTWMDSRCQGRPVARRAGKAVEVNALWHHALMTMADLGDRFRLRLRRQYARLARLVRAHFVQAFWNAEGGWLYDTLADRPDDAIRPNQLWAVALPYPLLSRAQGRAVLEVVGRSLLTPRGVRTLAPHHPEYQPAQAHQGAAWPWLLGAYWTGYLTVHGQTAATLGALRRAVGPLQRQLQDGGWGQCPQYVSGDPPQTPGGMAAQAWSVAELLRLMSDYALTDL